MPHDHKLLQIPNPAPAPKSVPEADEFAVRLHALPQVVMAVRGFRIQVTCAGTPDTNKPAVGKYRKAGLHLEGVADRSLWHGE